MRFSQLPQEIKTKLTQLYAEQREWVDAACMADDSAFCDRRVERLKILFDGLVIKYLGRRLTSAEMYQIIG